MKVIVSTSVGKSNVDQPKLIVAKVKFARLIISELEGAIRDIKDEFKDVKSRQSGTEIDKFIKSLQPMHKGLCGKNFTETTVQEIYDEL